MRLLRVTSFSLLIAAVSIFPVGTFAAPDAAQGLAKVEAQGLKYTGSKRLKAMITPPKVAPSAVQYSRSWIDAQPKARGADEWRCLSEALYFEARGETVKGQFAVAEVIMNRVKSTRFPGTLCGVINQGTGKKYGCQFTYTCDGHKEVIAEPKSFSRVSKVARAILDGNAPKLTDGATHYHTTAVNPNWAQVYTKTARIGDHLFYRHTYRSASN